MSGLEARGPEDMTRHWSGAPLAYFSFIERSSHRRTR
jgi:hypothetical protein